MQFNSADNFSSAKNLRKIALGEKIDNLQSAKNTKNFIENGNSSKFNFDNLKSKRLRLELNRSWIWFFYIQKDYFDKCHGHLKKSTDYLTWY